MLTLKRQSTEKENSAGEIVSIVCKTQPMLTSLSHWGLRKDAEGSEDKGRMRGGLEMHGRAGASFSE